MASGTGIPRILDARLPSDRAHLKRRGSSYAPAFDSIYFRIDIRPEVHGAELLPLIVPGGRLSWRWVLGEGPFYSSLPGAFCVVEPDGGTRSISTGLGEFDIRGMESHVFHAGFDEDNLDRHFDPFGRFVCATAERAICDWIYLSMRRKGYGEHGWGLGPAPDQVDLDELSLPRIRRLSDAMGILGNFERWYARWQEVQQDEEVTGKFSKALGY